MDSNAITQVVRKHVPPDVPDEAVWRSIDLVSQLLAVVGRYDRDLRTRGNGAVRRDKFEAVHHAALRLKTHLKDIGVVSASDMLRLGASKVKSADNAASNSPPQTRLMADLITGLRVTALNASDELITILEVLAVGAALEADKEKVRSVGRNTRSDPVEWGVEELAKIWSDILQGEVNLSVNNGSFVAFARDILEPAMNVSLSSIKHATDAMLKASKE